MTQKPKVIDDALYQLIRNDQAEAFNAQKPEGVECDFSGCDFRGVDMRNLDAAGINFRDAYFRGADLRGIDFRQSHLEGASLAHAHVSGAYFPDELTADEICMSVDRGTRMRYR